MEAIMYLPNNKIAKEATLPELLSVAKVARRLGVTPRTIVRWIREEVAFPNAYQKNPNLKTSPFVIPLSDVEEFESQRHRDGRHQAD